MKSKWKWNYYIICPCNQRLRTCSIFKHFPSNHRSKSPRRSHNVLHSEQFTCIECSWSIISTKHFLHFTNEYTPERICKWKKSTFHLIWWRKYQLRAVEIVEQRLTVHLAISGRINITTHSHKLNMMRSISSLASGLVKYYKRYNFTQE